ncbi:hypothetical protein C8R47DRAFT_1218750 [Mycena vitilis]|nr:hypothetical protein C8R47DRAFT_1218750 [Mycena vitilis]
MSIPLTFLDKRLLESTIVDPDGVVHYTTTTTRGFGGRKVTTINSATGVAGATNWREKTFVINSVQREVKDIKSRSGGVFDKERQWSWGDKSYKLKPGGLRTLLVRLRLSSSTE